MAEEQKKKYYIKAMGKPVEVSKEIYLAYFRMRRREQFLDEKDRYNGKVLYSDLDEDGAMGEEIIFSSEADSVEDQAIANAMTERLHQCLSTLPDDDLRLIHALYFEGVSEREYAKRIGISQRGVNKRRNKVLDKLRRKLT